MNVAVAYVYPLVNRQIYFPLAKRFAESWKQFPGAHLHLLCNGDSPTPLELRPFEGIDYATHTCSNWGWDIGAFQWAASHLPCDLLICLGAPVHFHKPGWLASMLDAYINHGPGLFGCWAYLSPNWHVRTTAFWCPPQLINSYPYQIASSRESRYDFEHGEHSFTRHVLAAGFPCMMVTGKGCFPFDQWHDHAPGVEDSLVLDQHTHK